MKMLKNLREATRQLHSELEGDNLANKIVNHTIKLEEYRLLLMQNYLAYEAAEKEIQKFLTDYQPDKTEQLKADLKGFDSTEFDSYLSFQCANEAEAIGAAYVVEGSAMGGMIIGKEIPACESLKALPEQKFYSGDRNNIKNWNNFLKFLRSRDFSEEEIETASHKAVETFQLFQEAFKLELSKI